MLKHIPLNDMILASSVTDKGQLGLPNMDKAISHKTKELAFKNGKKDIIVGINCNFIFNYPPFLENIAVA